MQCHRERAPQILKSAPPAHQMDVRYRGAMGRLLSTEIESQNEVRGHDASPFHGRLWSSDFSDFSLASQEAVIDEYSPIDQNKKSWVYSSEDGSEAERTCSKSRSWRAEPRVALP